MWRINALRERRTCGVVVLKSSLLHESVTTPPRRFQHNNGNAVVSFQLDYYMSPQFAGVAAALVNNTYQNKGIDPQFLPICPVGLELERVRRHQDEKPSDVSMGSVEQNIFVPTLASDPTLNTRAVSAMFHESPLCIASLGHLTSEENLKIGTHEDTVSIMQRIFPEHEVVASPRSSKNTDLISGELGAIQAYTTTEVPALCRVLDHKPVVTRLEGRGGAKLGYSQVLFAADECLEGDRREVVEAFCEATFEGWEAAISKPEEAVQMVREAKKMLDLDDEGNDHWHVSDSFQLEMLEKCNDYVKGTFDGGRYGVIDPSRWSSANRWLLEGKEAVDDFGLDPALWPKNT